MFYATEMTKSKPNVHTFRMRNKKFTATLKKAPKLRDTGSPHGLPPGEPVPVYPIESLPGCPDEWVRDPGTFVCPIDIYALWFDWTANDQSNTAIVASVKGMNPVTGQKMEDINLHRYVEKCPIHSCDFVGDRLCPKCDYKWPPQNYITSPNTLWWDGFRQPDGTVRQFFFTADEKRDIASLVIGKENTVPAFGFVFYEPKKEHVISNVSLRGAISPQSLSYFGEPSNDKWVEKTSADFYYTSSTSGPTGLTGSTGPAGPAGAIGDKGHPVSTSAVMGFGPEEISAAPRGMQPQSVRPRRMMSKSVSVGAGAEIHQDLIADGRELTEWKEKPSAMIRLYFVFEEQFEKIVSKGIKDLNGNKEGYLKDLPVG